MPRADLPEGFEADYLEDFRQRFERARGDRRVEILFSAIRFCGNQEIPLPEWAVEAFFKATNRWFSLQAGSLDEAFGARIITSKRLAQRRRRRHLEARLYSELSRLGPREGIDWQALAEGLGVGKTALQEIYYAGGLSRKFGRKSGKTRS